MFAPRVESDSPELETRGEHARRQGPMECPSAAMYLDQQAHGHMLKHQLLSCATSFYTRIAHTLSTTMRIFSHNPPVKTFNRGRTIAHVMS